MADRRTKQQAALITVTGALITLCLCAAVAFIPGADIFVMWVLIGSFSIAYVVMWYLIIVGLLEIRKDAKK